MYEILQLRILFRVRLTILAAWIVEYLATAKMPRPSSVDWDSDDVAGLLDDYRSRRIGTLAELQESLFALTGTQVHVNTLSKRVHKGGVTRFSSLPRTQFQQEVEVISIINL